MKRSIRISVLAAALSTATVAPVAVCASSENDIRVFGVRQVSTDRAAAKFVETTMATHPRDPRVAIAAAIVRQGDSTSVAVYSTRDAGRTWRPSPARANDTSRNSALDPWVIFTSDGTALFTYLTHGPENNFAVVRSRDGGRTWSEPTFVPGGLYDRQFLVEDADASSKYRGRIYGLGKINVRRLDGPPFQVMAISDSIDGGRTFSSPRLFVPPDDEDPLWVVAGGVTTGAGTLVLAFVTVVRPHPGDSTLRYTLWSTESVDGGVTLAKPQFLTSRVEPRGQAQSHLSVPSMAIARSGKYQGRIYLAWSQRRDDGYSIDVWRSQDEGTTWAGTTVSDNVRPAQHVTPAVAVNLRGDVAVAWYDRRDDPHGECHKLAVAASLDGGETFSRSVEATEARTCVTSGRFANVGDTLGIAADAAGRFHCAFISGGESTTMQLFEVPFGLDDAR